MEVSPLQLSNAQFSMLVTLEGIVTLVSPLQLENAFSPMLVTGFPLIVDRITKAPVGLVTYPVIVIDFPLVVYWKFPDVAATTCPQTQPRAATASATRFPRKTANVLKAFMR